MVPRNIVIEGRLLPKTLNISGSSAPSLKLRVLLEALVPGASVPNRVSGTGWLRNKGDSAVTKEMVPAASSSFAPSTQRAQSLKPACAAGRTIAPSVSRLLIRKGLTEPALGAGAGRDQGREEMYPGRSVFPGLQPLGGGAAASVNHHGKSEWQSPER